MKIPGLLLLTVTGLLLAHFQATAKNDNFYQEMPAATPAMTFDGRGFTINGQRTFIASGDIHYPRVPQALWRDRLLRLKRAGLNCVQTYVFMNYHSPQEGVYDFSGEKDFSLYLRQIHELGLFCTVRAGMYVCSEWDNGGYPEWLLLKPGLSLRTAETQFLAAHDSWYGKIMPIVATNQINRGGSVILVQLDNEHPSCWGVDTANQSYFTHLRTNALALGIEVPTFFSGVHHAHAPAGTAPFDSVGRTTPWYSTEFWAGWFNLYGGTINLANTYDRDTWQILAYGGNGYNYYMFHGGGNFDHWNANGIGASYDYGAALGQTGDFRPLYYRDKRAALFARSFQAILENSTNASAAYAGAAANVSAISARGGSAGAILFLDNNTGGNATAVLTNGAQMTLEAYEIAPVVKNFALANWLTISEADARIFGVQPQGTLTTLVLYGLPGETVRVGFTVTSGAVTYADPVFGTNAVNPSTVSFSASVTDGTPAAYQLCAGANSLRVLVMSKTAVDRTWFVDSAGANYVVTGAAYVGEFTNANNRITCSLEEPVGNALPANLLVFDGAQFAPRALTITNSISSSPLTAPTLANWQMRLAADRAAINYDDSLWFATNTPPLMGMDGDASHYAWYRTSVTVANAGNYTLNFTGINDWGSLFINGQPVPMTAANSAYSVPVTLQAGANALAIFTSQVGRDSLYSVTGTSSTGFTPKGLLGAVGLSTASSSASVTNWYWLNVGSSAPSPADVTAMTDAALDLTAGGWNNGAGWNGNVFSGAGYAWFRTVLPALSGASHSLHFTNVDDNCTVYLNGANIVGAHNGWGKPFDASLDAYWQANGTNVLTILVQNTGGGGGLNGTVLLNAFDPAGSFSSWKLQGGVGPVEGTNVTWQPLATANGLPVFYRATFQYLPPPGVLPILRANWSGLSAGFIWLNGHALGRYPETIPTTSIYLPECWLSATNELVYFEEQGKAPGSVALVVESSASRQLLQCAASTSAPTNVLPPASLNASPGNTSIGLTWSASVGTTNYSIWRGLSSGNETTRVGTTAGTTYTDTGLLNGTTYYYVVTAAGPAGVSTNSPEASATPNLPPPVSLNAYPGDTQILLTWAVSAGATNYTIWRGFSAGNETTRVASTAATTYTDTGLANGTTYYYVVTAVGSGDVSGNSPEASATPDILAPASLTAASGNHQIVLTWAGSAGATNYFVWRGPASGIETTVVGTTTGTTFTDAGLANGTACYYVVTASGPGGVSANSPEASATPSPYGSSVWNADANGNWGDAKNWLGAVIAGGADNTADFSALILTADRTVTLDAPLTIGTLKFGDPAAAHNWTLAGTNPLTLGSTPVINVASQNATITAVIAGTAFTKTGPGGLTLAGAAANSFTGTLAVNGGALTEDFSNLGTPTDLINNGVTLTLGGGVLNLNGAASGNTSQTLAGTILTAGENGIKVTNNGGSAVLALGSLTVTKGATLNFSATGVITTSTAGGDASGVLGARGNTASPVGYATVGQYDWASTFTGAGVPSASPHPIIGLSSVAGGYVTTFPGTGQNANTDLLANSTIGANTGTSTLRFNTPAAYNVNVNGKWFVAGAVLVTPNMGAVNTSISGGNWFPYYTTTAAADEVIWQNNTLGYFVNTGGLINNRGQSGTTVTYIQAGPGTVVQGTANAYTGQSYLNGGDTVITTASGLGAPATAATVNLNGGTVVANATLALDNGGANPRPISLLGNGGGLAATAGNTLTVDGLISGDVGTGPLTLGIPASDANNHTLGLLPGSGSGTANAAVNATGAVLLSSANTYTGNTLVSSGTLLVGNPSGSATGSGAVTVSSGGALGGTGLIAGAVAVNAGGALAPGNPLGLLILSSNLALAAGSVTFAQVQHSPPTNSAVRIGGTFNAGGTLIVTNLGAALAQGDSFELFSAGHYAGAFNGLVLPPLTGNLAWNTSALHNAGALSVVALTQPIFGGIRIAAGSLVLSGSNGPNGWPFLLLASTNLAAPQWTPVATNQFDPLGGFILTNAIGPNSALTFYRLQLR